MFGKGGPGLLAVGGHFFGIFQDEVYVDIGHFGAPLSFGFAVLLRWLGAAQEKTHAFA
jgi:hypothetical protein